jgi:hypothetical protein
MSVFCQKKLLVKQSYDSVVIVCGKKMEPNPGEKEAIVEWQEIPNEEVEIHSLRACRNERTACQEAMKANPEKLERWPFWNR